MRYLGCDVHRDYTTVSVVSENGEVVSTSRCANNEEGLRALCERFPRERFSAVLEAGLNWGVVYDLLEGLEEVDRVVLAHPPKVKAIASAKIKTDKIDSKILARLLRADLIPEVWVPPRDVRVLKSIVRYRAFVVKVRTMVKNRIHDLLRKAHVEAPEAKDLFGRYGREWLEAMELRDEREDELLGYHLKVYDFLTDVEKGLRRWIEREMKENEELELLKTVPGIGEVFGAILVLKIGKIDRFPDPAHFHSYSGLVPSTHVSGSTQYHGRLIKGNKWLRWAFIEGAHTSVKISPCFREHYTRVKRRAGSQAASVSAARKLATVVYRVLKGREPYREMNKKSRLPSVRSSQGNPGSLQE